MLTSLFFLFILYIILVVKLVRIVLDITYCYECCEIGKTAGRKLLHLNESVFDAAAAFQQFTENCFKLCPYAQAQVDSKNKEN